MSVMEMHVSGSETGVQAKLGGGEVARPEVRGGVVRGRGRRPVTYQLGGLVECCMLPSTVRGGAPVEQCPLSANVIVNVDDCARNWEGVWRCTVRACRTKPDAYRSEPCSSNAHSILNSSGETSELGDGDRLEKTTCGTQKRGSALNIALSKCKA